MMQNLLVAIVCCLLISGCCAQKSTFVLLPDPDGKVGQITVTNDQGARTLDQAREAVTVAGESGQLSQVEVMTEKKIRSLFGQAIDAQPLQPAKFSLYFVFDSTQLKPESRDKLNAMVQAARERNSLDISINGHSDRVGKEEYNMSLSVQRATEVESLLVKQGIDPQVISTTSHGEGNPLVVTEDNVAEPRNRRVEVIIR